MDVHNEGVERTMQGIAAGANNLLTVVNQRIIQAVQKLDGGDFIGARSDLSDAYNAITPLATAQGQIGSVENTRLVKAADLETGMTIAEMGEITEVDVESCPGVRCPGHVRVKFGDEHGAEFRGNAELFIEGTDEDARG